MRKKETGQLNYELILVLIKEHELVDHLLGHSFIFGYRFGLLSVLVVPFFIVAQSLRFTQK
jgi:hypothetical protein